MADINVYGTLKSMAGDGKVALASQIYDSEKGKFQSEINNETANDGLVSSKVAQSFTNAEKAQARENIGAGDLQGITQEQFDAIFQ